jgi:hypothetical protein
MSENGSLISVEVVAFFHKSPMYESHWNFFVTNWQKFAKEKNAGTWKVKTVWILYTIHNPSLKLDI